MREPFSSTYQCLDGKWQKIHGEKNKRKRRFQNSIWSVIVNNAHQEVSITTYSRRKDPLLQRKTEKKKTDQCEKLSSGFKKCDPHPPTFHPRVCQVRTVTCVADIRGVNELSHNLLLGVTVHVLGHQLVHAVVDVRGVDELQAAVVLALGGDVDHGVDKIVLQERLVVVVPLELRLGVAGHGEGDAPVVVEHGLQELQDGWRDWVGAVRG